MNLDCLPIPDQLKSRYHEAGIRTLYPPQEDCVRAGMFEGRNMLIAVPTASGKTLIAEMAMHHQISRGGKCLYIVPLKALASEKFEEFSRKGIRVGIATGDFDRRDEFLGKNGIIVATSEKVDSLLRNATPWLKDITLLVIDEVHLIDSPDRGPTLEMLITKMRFRNPRMQLIALSATIGNPKALADWLDAALVTSEWRPVDLRPGVFLHDRIYFSDNTQRPVPGVSRHDALNLCMDTIAEGGQCLVFVSSRRNAEAFAKQAAKALGCASPELTAYAARLKKIAETDMGKILVACVENGSAFHHAGLRREERAIVEEAFRKGLIKIIASTPTLAAGLNLPARRVVIKEYRRFSAGAGMLPIPVSEYQQMAGRAGRPGLDPYGEAVLIARDEQDLDSLFECYIDAPPEDVHSQCAQEKAICAHILSVIASGFVRSRDDLMAFMDQTFYVFQHRQTRSISRVIDRVLTFLGDAELITEVSNSLSATGYGGLVSSLYLDPRSADLLVGELRSRSKYADLGLLQLICSTPDMYTLYVSNSDRYYLDRFICEHEDELWIEPPVDGDDESYYRAVKTCMLLSDWADEVPDAMICERYGVGPGDIYAMVESVNWLLHAAGRLARMFAPRFSRPVHEYEICMKHGIRRELLPLIRLKNIGRVRARRLFNNGITDPDLLKAAGTERIAEILGRGLARQLFEKHKDSAEQGELEGGPQPGQPTLSDFGDRT
jgi:helicase